MPGSIPLERIRDAFSGTYTIDRELGRGGMATVYLAQDAKHERLVALKVLHPDIAASLGPERFLREIKLAARLNHPHILPLHDSGETSSFLYYVMPYVEGESLRERLDRDHQLPIDEAVHHARAIASALDYAHRQGIVHRDIKPENVMLYEGEAMVMDFGIAKAVSSAGGGETITQTGMMIGTPAYVSPEQAAGDVDIDGRSDQYSLGCVLFEMLSGERPFTGPTPQAVMTKRFTEAVPSVKTMRSSVPDPVAKALSRAMSVDAGARFKTAAQFSQALASGSVTTPTDTTTLPQQAVSSAKSVAVLPFANMSTDAENEYFADGMAEEIINALSKIQSLRVASRTVSFALKGKNEDLADVGKKLHVSTVLDGSVRRMGNRLRITAQLVNVADGYQLWSDRYDREMEDVFAIQDDISQAIVKALRVILTEGEKKQIEKARAVNVQAYDYYLRGRQYFHQLRRKSLEYAKQMFTKATEIDPEYARAYAGVSDCYSQLYTYFDAREFNLRQADVASIKALELEPELAEAHVSRGLVSSMFKKFEDAEREFEMAMKLDPKLFDAVYWYARSRLSQGEYEEAVKLFERAAVLRPEDYQMPGFLGQALMALGKKDDAIASYRRQVKLIDVHLELNPDDPRACILGAVANAIIGDRERAVEFIQRGIHVDPDDPMLLYNVCCTYAQLGMVKESLDALEHAVEKGWGDRAWLEHDSDLDTIRNEPRYKSIVQAM